MCVVKVTSEVLNFCFLWSRAASFFLLSPRDSVLFIVEDIEARRETVLISWSRISFIFKEVETQIHESNIAPVAMQSRGHAELRVLIKSQEAARFRLRSLPSGVRSKLSVSMLDLHIRFLSFSFCKFFLSKFLLWFFSICFRFTSFPKLLSLRVLYSFTLQYLFSPLLLHFIILSGPFLSLS